jgi:hypothetical protein
MATPNNNNSGKGEVHAAVQGASEKQVIVFHNPGIVADPLTAGGIAIKGTTVVLKNPA